MAGIVRACLKVGIPAPEDENAFMRTLARNRTATSPVYMGRSIIENVYFPGAVAYSPDGYSFLSPRDAAKEVRPPWGGPTYLLQGGKVPWIDEDS